MDDHEFESEDYEEVVEEEDVGHDESSQVITIVMALPFAGSHRPCSRLSLLDSGYEIDNVQSIASVSSFGHLISFGHPTSFGSTSQYSSLGSAPDFSIPFLKELRVGDDIPSGYLQRYSQ
ncbi:hypothetical protein LWI29_007605 [Acer saccharum]|uniref:Uncharacterized protein n=1 Tax=Acer saccharum TaxID=4024 RepID=A0AA39RN70_ACESA|nr:hypothetical protein LWI29_007605 [Acer saccharum]